jgi:hypothetical protein
VCSVIWVVTHFPGSVPWSHLVDRSAIGWWRWFWFWFTRDRGRLGLEVMRCLVVAPTDLS